MVLAALVIAFTIGPTWMFVGLGGSFLAASLSVLASRTSQLIPLIVVWGLIGVLFLLIGGLGLRSERRDRQGDLGLLRPRRRVRLPSPHPGRGHRPRDRLLPASGARARVPQGGRLQPDDLAVCVDR